jgi:hypothetical protein
MTPAPSFDAFYADYLREHRHPANRALHLGAKLAMAVALVAAVRARSIGVLLLVPVLGVAPCWLGHWLFEGNQPTSRTRPDASLLGTLLMRRTRSRGGRPYYSFAADVRMCAAMLRGRLDERVERR